MWWWGAFLRKLRGKEKRYFLCTHLLFVYYLPYLSWGKIHTFFSGMESSSSRTERKGKKRIRKVANGEYMWPCFSLLPLTASLSAVVSLPFVFSNPFFLFPQLSHPSDLFLAATDTNRTPGLNAPFHHPYLLYFPIFFLKHTKTGQKSWYWSWPSTYWAHTEATQSTVFIVLLKCAS